MTPELGQKIKTLRSERGWSQNELAQRSGLARGYLANLEGSKPIKRPSGETFIKLAHAFNIHPDKLYQAAGYIKVDTTIRPRQETPEEILDRLKLAQPVSIPVYTDFPFHAGESTEPNEYIYRARSKDAARNIEGYIVHGKCMEPKITEGDVIIVDRDSVINHGDIIACLIDGQLKLGHLKRIADELWLENNEVKTKFEQCQVAAVVIEVIRRLK